MTIKKKIEEELRDGQEDGLQQSADNLKYSITTESIPLDNFGTHLRLF